MAREQTELAALRKNEIIEGFREVTIKEISRKTSFSRPSIYNYLRQKRKSFSPF